MAMFTIINEVNNNFLDFPFTDEFAGMQTVDPVDLWISQLMPQQFRGYFIKKMIEP